MIKKSKISNQSTFGKRLAQIRKQRGFSQAQLAKLVGVTIRTIAYYEVEANNLPAKLIKPLAEALNVSTDHLIGITNFKQEISPKQFALWRRFKKIDNLSVRDQKALFHYLNALLEKNKKG
ncbi:MAG: XRE family transcriptional regulator [Dehalococcoidia bacterium]|nr:MAG: XRE family transcriptional regulator [Dehalococcoidia bacterium]